MTDDLCRMLVESFLKTSWPTVKTIVEKLRTWEGGVSRKPISLFRFESNRRVDKTIQGNCFLLRSSVEYSNPQLTVEEVQGIVAAKLLEVCGNFFHEEGLREPDANDVNKLCEKLKTPSHGKIVAFLLNTDDIEPDRYSMNPLKQSLLASGQSAFPAASVNTDCLKVDDQFIKKYECTLVSKSDVEIITAQLANANGSYVDFSDSVKYAQLEKLSEAFGMDLSLYALRMPVAMLQAETKDGLLHHVIGESHRDFEAVKQAYDCMGRSITNRTTLLTVPHSRLGFGSKRAARGKLRFDGNKLEKVTVTYKPTRLYPNAIDPDDVAVARAEDSFTVTGEQLSDYSFAKTPSSPQFFLYSLGSPENAALWHGVGAFAAPQLLQSYSSVRKACREGKLIKRLKEFGAHPEVPLQFNLSPEGMWVHPIHRNIDASIGCVENPVDLARMGMKIEYLARYG